MTPRPLLIFDFDGVIVDGMNEYWWSARQACLNLLGGRSKPDSLPNAVPATFQELRPWVHQGWEMVLLAAEMLRPDSPLLLQGASFFSKDYHLQCKDALKAWAWSPLQLQDALENVRREAIAFDKKNWLNLHKPFPGLVERLNQLPNEGIEWAVLTTKGAAFAAELLTSFQLEPILLHGHESGSKSKVLLQLTSNWLIQGFVEDRRATLETVLNTPGLTAVPCYLASWGYLKDQDRQALPPGIHLLKPETLATPLARWP